MSDDRPTADPRRFFFLHMQKTGGTSLYLRLPRVVGWEGLYPNESDGDPVAVAPQLSIPVLLERWPQRRHEVRIVAGHFPLCTTELLGEPFRVVTVLREPVERTLSYLRHHRQTTPADRDLPLEAVYEDPFRYEGMVHDHMVKMLGMTADEMTDGLLTRLDLGPEHLARAVERLEQIEVVGTVERYESSGARCTTSSAGTSATWPTPTAPRRSTCRPRPPPHRRGQRPGRRPLRGGPPDRGRAPRPVARPATPPTARRGAGPGGAATRPRTPVRRSVTGADDPAAPPARLRAFAAVRRPSGAASHGRARTARCFRSGTW